jgi:hypothetical protein
MVRKHSDASPQQGEAMSSSRDMPYVQEVRLELVINLKARGIWPRNTSEIACRG